MVLLIQTTTIYQMSKGDSLPPSAVHRLITVLFVMPKLKRALSEYNLTISKGAATNISEFIVWYMDNNPKHKNILTSIGLQTIRGLLS